MRRIATRVAGLAALIFLMVGCQSIETPWDRMRKQFAKPPAATEAREALDEPDTEERPRADRRATDPIIIPQQARGAYSDSPSSP